MSGVLTGDDDRRLPQALVVLAVASAFCGALALTRVFYSGRLAFIWLGWNLILAWVPLLLALVIAHRHAPGKRPSVAGRRPCSARSGWPSFPTRPTW